MSDHTMSEVQEGRRVVQRALLDVLLSFERAYGVETTDLSMERVDIRMMTDTVRRSELVGIHVEVKL